MTRSDEEDRLDSNMALDARGHPYTMSEAEGAVAATPKGVLPYHVEIMSFLIRRVKRLTLERDGLAKQIEDREASDPSCTCTHPDDAQYCPKCSKRPTE